MKQKINTSIPFNIREDIINSASGAAVKRRLQLSPETILLLTDLTLGHWLQDVGILRTKTIKTNQNIRQMNNCTIAPLSHRHEHQRRRKISLHMTCYL